MYEPFIFCDLPLAFFYLWIEPELHLNRDFFQEKICISHAISSALWVEVLITCFFMKLVSQRGRFWLYLSRVFSILLIHFNNFFYFSLLQYFFNIFSCFHIFWPWLHTFSSSSWSLYTVLQSGRARCKFHVLIYYTCVSSSFSPQNFVVCFFSRIFLPSKQGWLSGIVYCDQPWLSATQMWHNWLMM